MKRVNKKIKTDILSQDFLYRVIIMTICCFALAMTYNIFLLYNDLVIGGISGIAIIVKNFIDINPAIFMLVINILLIILSFFLLGPESTGLSIIGSLLYPLFVSLTSPFCNDIANNLVIGDFLLIVLITGTIVGVADGFLYKTGFTTGGTDIVIQLMQKYLHLSSGKASRIVSVSIIIGGSFTFGLTNGIYAILIVLISSYLVDRILIGISDSKMFYIITDRQDEVKSFISQMGNGFTMVKTVGGYSKEGQDLIMLVINTRDYYLFKNAINRIDPDAFIIISDCYDTQGGKRKEGLPFM